MHLPAITAAYLALLALLYAVLALQVIRLRQGNRAAFGDGDNISLRSAIRVHGNFIEYVPIITLMVAFLEMSGASAARISPLDGCARDRPPAPSARHVCRAHQQPAISDRPRRRLHDHDRPADRLRATDPVAARSGQHGLTRYALTY